MRSEKTDCLMLEMASAIMMFMFLLISIKSALFLGETTLTHDNLYWFLPFFHFFSEGIARGEFYLWNPFSHAGEPTITAYLQLRLLDPISILIVLIGKLFTQDTFILFSWDRFLRTLIGSVGAYILLRRWTDQVLVRISLQAIVLFTPFLTNGLHQNGITDQFYIAPYFLIFLLRLLHKKDYRLHNWVGMSITFGISFQSYFFVGASILGLFILIGFFLFRRDDLLGLARNRLNLLHALVSISLLLVMSAPMVVYYMDHNDYVYPARASDQRRAVQTDERRAYGGSFNVIDLGIKSDNNNQSLMMPYDIIWRTGTFSKPSDILDLIAPQSGGAITHKQKYSEAHIYVGLLVFLCALYGMFFSQHELKRVWILVTSLFALLILGPVGLLHQWLYYILPPLWFVRHTHQFVNFFIFGLLFFYVVGADRIIRRLLAHDQHNQDVAELPSLERGMRPLVVVWLLLGAILVLAGYVYGESLLKRALELVTMIFIIFMIGVYFTNKKDITPLFKTSGIITGGTILIVLIGNELVRYSDDFVGRIHTAPFLIAAVIVLVFLLRRWLGKASAFIALTVALLLIAYVNSRAWPRLTAQVLAFLALPVALLFTSKYLGDVGKKWIAHVLTLCVIFDVALALSFVDAWKQTRPNYCLDIPALGAINQAQPVRRVTARVGCKLSSYGQPIRYMELLSHQYVALGLPAHYPSEGNTMVGNETFKDVISVGVWNTFSYLQGYNKLLRERLPDPVLEEIFSIDKPVIQFRRHLYVVNDFIETILAMEPPEAAEVLRNGIFVENVGPSTTKTSVKNAGGWEGSYEQRVSYSYNRIAIDTRSRQPGYLYFADGYDKYWRATIDDVETPVLKANLNFKAVALPAGEHRVIFEYAPTMLRRAIWVFELTFLLGMAYVLFCEWRSRRRKHGAISA